jgi:peptidoglycan/xylan/chitin deacetylase (PgdA/CDA1 family)
MKLLLLLPLAICIFSGCAGGSEKPANHPVVQSTQAVAATPTAMHDSASHKADTGMTSGLVPILCYHQIRDWTAKDSKTAKVYIVPVASFKAQIKMLHDSGYHAILPDQLMAYLDHGTPLPSKPIMLTFDDGDESQYTVALPELDKAGYKAVFFVMTVSLNRPNYFAKDQVKELAAKGHVIGCHTWDHHMTTKYTPEDWVKQVEKPRALLAQLSGSPVKYFAYPFGLWNEPAVSHLKNYGFTAAFSLSGKTDHEDPSFTLNRQIVDGSWSTKRLHKTITRKPAAGTKKGVMAGL